MGLDLTLMRKQDVDSDKWDNDLAYGRKTWAIANWFMSRSNMIEEEYMYEVPESVWDEFYARSYVFKDKIETLLKAIDLEDDVVSPVAYDRLEDTLSDLLDDDRFTLGADWEAYALIRWIEANDKIKEAYKEGPVYLVASW